MSCGMETVIDSPAFKPDEAQAVALPLSDPNMVAEPPPDGGYGWICVASVFIINGFTWGLTAVRNSAESTLISIFACCCHEMYHP